jgi:hypothetical protein
MVSHIGYTVNIVVENKSNLATVNGSSNNNNNNNNKFRPSFTKLCSGKRGSAAVGPIFPSYWWDSDEGTEQSPKHKKHE